MLYSVTQWFVANLYWIFFYAKHYCMRLHVPLTPLIQDSVTSVSPLGLRRERLKFCCWCVWCFLVLICHSLTRCLFSLPFCWSQRRSPVSVPLPPPPWVSAHMSHAFCCLSLLTSPLDWVDWTRRQTLGSVAEETAASTLAVLACQLRRERNLPDSPNHSCACLRLPRHHSWSLQWEKMCTSDSWTLWCLTSVTSCCRVFHSHPPCLLSPALCPFLSLPRPSQCQCVYALAHTVKAHTGFLGWKLDR